MRLGDPGASTGVNALNRHPLHKQKYVFKAGFVDMSEHFEKPIEMYYEGVKVDFNNQ